LTGEEPSMSTIPAGYKQTEVGVIPEDWKSTVAETICDVRDGTHDSPKYLAQGVPFITSKNIISGKIDFSEVVYISHEDAKEINKRSKVDKDDILMSMIGTVGNAVHVNFEPVFCIKNVALLKPRNVNPSFLAQLLSTAHFQQYIESKLDGGIQKFIALGVIRKLEIPLPPLPEQQRIAQVLGDVDALIQKLEALIAKKRDIKQASMQELLTGKRRLPGFSGAWETKRLGEVCRITTGKKDVNEGNPSGQYPFFTCAREHTFSDFYSFDCDAILVAGNGEVGNLNYYNGKFEVYQRTYVLTTFTESTMYIWHQLNAFLAPRLGIGKIGSSIPYIKKSDLTFFNFKLPELIEQIAIAQVLSDMDAELEKLETRLAKTRDLKAGLMRELLTGRIRLRVAN